MGFELKDIAYGWKIGIAAVLTGATIFVVSNTRQRFYQRDAVELILGTHERCLAAGATPLSFVRSWYGNAYELSGTNWVAVLYTNIYTNVISSRIDRSMIVSLDAKIEALASYFVDTNTVYDGTTNIVMNTFTGLLTSLDIGDHTNFTPYGWRVSQDELKERYKVLNRYKIVKKEAFSALDMNFVTELRYSWGEGFATNWATAVSETENKYLTDPHYFSTNEHAIGFCEFQYQTDGRLKTAGSHKYYEAAISRKRTKLLSINTNYIYVNMDIPHENTFWLKSVTLPKFACDAPDGHGGYHYGGGATKYFDDNNMGVSTNVWNLIETGDIVTTNTGMISWFGDALINIPNWVPKPTTDDVIGSAYPTFTNYFNTKGFYFSYYSFVVLLNYAASTNGFQYCTNIYWTNSVP